LNKSLNGSYGKRKRETGEWRPEKEERRLVTERLDGGEKQGSGE
jgi:hypothetical protein